ACSSLVLFLIGRRPPLSTLFPYTTLFRSVLRNLQAMFDHGRLGGTGYLSILPVDQGVEHSGASAFAPNPRYFDPANIVELAIDRSEEHTSELQSRENLVCRLLLEKKNTQT